jgi:hypothetical protein
VSFVISIEKLVKGPSATKTSVFTSLLKRDDYTRNTHERVHSEYIQTCLNYIRTTYERVYFVVRWRETKHGINTGARNPENKQVSQANKKGVILLGVQTKVQAPADSFIINHLAPHSASNDRVGNRTRKEPDESKLQDPPISKLERV